MSLVGSKVDNKRNQAKTRKMSHHLLDRNQQENKEELIDVVL
jgi:hypothetical protein